MSETKHTPGPWVAYEDDFCGGYYGGPADGRKPWAVIQEVDGLCLAVVVPDCLPNVEANARVLAAAPDLLASAREVRDEIEAARDVVFASHTIRDDIETMEPDARAEFDRLDGMLQRLDAAIAKAGGA